MLLAPPEHCDAIQVHFIVAFGIPTHFCRSSNKFCQFELQGFENYGIHVLAGTRIEMCHAQLSMGDMLWLGSSI